MRHPEQLGRMRPGQAATFAAILIAYVLIIAAAVQLL